MPKRLAWGCALVIAPSFTACTGKLRQIEAIDPIPVFPGIEASNTPDALGAIAMVLPGHRVELLECIDIKSDVVYRVRLADGRRGIVNGARQFRSFLNGIEASRLC